MAGLPEVIGLLYRADWTRLSLSAELCSEADREPLPRLSREGWSRWYRAWPGQRQDNGRHVGRGALLIGSGGRWRLECSVPGRAPRERPPTVTTASAAGRGDRRSPGGSPVNSRPSRKIIDSRTVSSSAT